jgi:hypothetical protein
MLINIAKFQKRILSKCTLAKFHVSPEPDFVRVCLITFLFPHTGRELISSHGPFSLRLAGKFSALKTFFKGNELAHRRRNFREAHKLKSSLITMCSQSPPVSKPPHLLVALLQRRRHKAVGFFTSIHSVVLTISANLYPTGTKYNFLKKVIFDQI